MVEVTHVVGARPNFPKLAPVYRALASLGTHQSVIHTGQHYDDAMSGSFFRQLGIPNPDVNLEVGSGSHGAQTARLLERLEATLSARRPDWLVVYGDVNSTMAATLVAAKSGIPCAHVEAGLRSRDLSMPEEINRLVTDRLANLLLTTSRDADVELLREGRDASDVVFVGNVMIDTLMSTMSSINSTEARRRLKVSEDAVVVTLHRPSNVDDPARLSQIISCLRAVAMRRQVVFFAHPRTLAVLGRSAHSVGAIDVRSPAEYRDLIALASSAPVVVTDSGGLQEETTVLGTPCLTLRDNTERPITVEQGTNRLVRDLTELERLVDAAVRPIAPPVIEGWDGRAGERVAHAILARSS